MLGTGIISRLAVIVALVVPCGAQLGARTLLLMPRLGGQTTISPDGAFVAYLIYRRSTPNEDHGNSRNGPVAGLRETSELWITDLRTRKSYRACCRLLPHGLGSEMYWFYLPPVDHHEQCVNQTGV
jgi:hypothetical protein